MRSEFQLTATIGLVSSPFVSACIFLRNRSCTSSEVLPPRPTSHSPIAPGIDRRHEYSSGSMTRGVRASSNRARSAVRTIFAPGAIVEAKPG